MNLETLIEFVQNSSLEPGVKEVLADRLMAEGLTTDTADVLRQAFQDQIDELFDAAGVKIDPKDPEALKQFQTYEEGLQALEAEGVKEMKELEVSLNGGVAQAQSSADGYHADQIRQNLP